MASERETASAGAPGSAIQAGVIFLPLNTAYTATEVGYFVENSGARLLLCDPKSAATLAPMAPHVLTLAVDGLGTFGDLVRQGAATYPTEARAPEDLAAFLYTSGTTGRSKGAMLSHANLLSNAEVLVDFWRFGSGDVLLHALPIFHTHGLFVATNVALLAGCPMIFLP